MSSLRFVMVVFPSHRMRTHDKTPPAGGTHRRSPHAGRLFATLSERRMARARAHDGVTEIVEIPNRGHALASDSGWREVADTTLAFVQRLVK
jgi:hypothetical protein